LNVTEVESKLFVFIRNLHETTLSIKSWDTVREITKRTPNWNAIWRRCQLNFDGLHTFGDFNLN